LNTSTDDTGAPAQPDPKPRRIRSAARPAFMRGRHWIVAASLVIMVLAPTAVAAIYLYTTAADQYASKVGFAVRSEENSSAMDLLGSMTSLSGSSSSDTDILYQFIQSQELIEAVDEELGLRKIFSKPKRDWVFRLPEDASIEDIVDYWSSMIRIDYDPGTGLIEIQSRAFDPVDARDLSRSIFAHSSTMINQLSAVARGDVTRYARDELDQAVERLKQARQAVTRFRNINQIVDPSADIQGQMGLLNSLQEQLANTIIELDLLTETTRENDPRVDSARRKVDVIRKRIASERRNLGVGEGADREVFADLVGQFESLQVDRKFAEEAYVASLSAYDSSLAEARRQNRYLAAYLSPTLAQTPQYPQRGLILGLLSMLLFGTWAISVLIYYSLRDRR
jgi:capsular polysaccharide transport system permease protein